jgi:hypothetical protein
MNGSSRPVFQQPASAPRDNFTVTAVFHEHAGHYLSVVASDLKTVATPAQVWFRHIGARLRRLEVYVLGQADQYIADLGAQPTFLFCK